MKGIEIRRVRWMGLETRELIGLRASCAFFVDMFPPRFNKQDKETWLKNGPPVPAAVDWRAPEIKGAER